MKKGLILLAVLAICSFNEAESQVSGLIKKVKNNVANDLINGIVDGSQSDNKSAPEPSCACNDAVVVMELGGKLQLDYKELFISVLDDGSLLARDGRSDRYYIVKNGVTDGPYRADDPKIEKFRDAVSEMEGKVDILSKYSQFISKSGDKFIITFKGKTYGPFVRIDQFAVSMSGEKFAALVTEKELMSETRAKDFDVAMKKAKTEEEQMQIAMEYAMQMQDAVAEMGGNINLAPILVTNIPDAKYDPATNMGAAFNGKINYDDILLVAYDKIFDLRGNNILTIKQSDMGKKEFFVNSSNTKYAAFSYGTLTFSDNKTLSDLFNPRLIKTEGKVFLTYMYYSPKRNAVVQCKLPF